MLNLEPFELDHKGKEIAQFKKQEELTISHDNKGKWMDNKGSVELEGYSVLKKISVFSVKIKNFKIANCPELKTVFLFESEVTNWDLESLVNFDLKISYPGKTPIKLLLNIPIFALNSFQFSDFPRFLEGEERLNSLQNIFVKINSDKRKKDNKEFLEIVRSLDGLTLLKSLNKLISIWQKRALFISEMSKKEDLPLEILLTIVEKYLPVDEDLEGLSWQYLLNFTNGLSLTVKNKLSLNEKEKIANFIDSGFKNNPNFFPLSLWEIAAKSSSNLKNNSTRTTLNILAPKSTYFLRYDSNN